MNFEIPSIKEIKNVIKENPELNGLNVTIPYKEQVIPYLDDLDDDARQIGADFYAKDAKQSVDIAKKVLG